MERNRYHSLGRPMIEYSRRELRGLAIVARGNQVTKIEKGLYHVRSTTIINRLYRVSLENAWPARWSCNCPDFLKKGKNCKHIFAVIFYENLPSIAAGNGYRTDCLQKADHTE